MSSADAYLAKTNPFNQRADLVVAISAELAEAALSMLALKEQLKRLANPSKPS